ncbi:MAG: glycosyltransferase family 9 protein [Verrucomicrobiota bacterium]
MCGFAKKTLAIQFKYLGDAVFITPALRALKECEPDGELHVLLAADIAPLLENLSWITKVWSLPRTRGRARLRDSWPIIQALRRERFDRSVDFGGNDRGAILSFLSGARQRLGAVDKTGLLHKICYSLRIHTATLPPAWVQRHLQLLSAWQIPASQSTHLEIAADPALAEEAAQLLPDGMIVCHLGTSQPRKEWPLARWQEFYRLARAAGFPLAFSSGTSGRERALLLELKKMEPEIFVLPPLASLKLFLAVLRRARAVVAGDTGPLHFAAGLGVPVVGLFGAEDSLLRAAPIYKDSQIVKSEDSPLGGPLNGTQVDLDRSCLEGVSAGRVLAALTKAAPAH